MSSGKKSSGKLYMQANFLWANVFIFNGANLSGTFNICPQMYVKHIFWANVFQANVVEANVFRENVLRANAN
jgi:hypothetical protein